MQLARSLLKRSLPRPVHFVWLGRVQKTDLARYMYDVKCMGITGFVHFIGARVNPWDYLAEFDVLSLTSREDPFPLVMMEAAALSVPVAAFNGSGGAEEFVTRNNGVCVPYLDVEAMADALAALACDEARRLELGIRGRERVLQGHHINVQAPKLLASIRRLMSSAPESN